MNPLLLLALFGGGAFAYVKSKKKTAISYPSDESSSGASSTATSSAPSSAEVQPVPWVQPDYTLKDFTGLTWFGILNFPDGGSKVYGGGDRMKAPLLAAQEFIDTRDARSRELVDGVLTVREEQFDSFLANQGYDGYTDSKKFKSEVFVLIPQIGDSVREFRVNLRNGGVAISKKIYDRDVRAVITESNANEVIFGLEKPSALSNNVGIRVPFADMSKKTANYPAQGKNFQMIVYNTPQGNVIVNVTYDANGKRTITPYKSV